MAYPCEVGPAGVTRLQGSTFDRVLLIQATTQSALIRRALNEMFIRDGYLTVEQLEAEAAESRKAK